MRAAAPAIMASSAPTAAPPETPSTYGSARELRNSACSSTPERASRLPTPKAASTRGRRTRQEHVAGGLVPGARQHRQSLAQPDAGAADQQGGQEDRHGQQDQDPEAAARGEPRGAAVHSDGFSHSGP